MWDFTTSIPELMKSLNALADQGKVLYLGVCPTWGYELWASTLISIQLD
jgi:hypothetical protein